MPTKHKHHKRRHTKKSKAPRPATPKAITAASAAEFGVPFWLLWGIAGAESTWGRGGTNLFGLLDAAEGANISDWRSASHQAAKTLRGLHDSYGSWPAAVEHYSGNSYTIGHPKELAGDEGVTPRNSQAVQERVLADIETPLGTIPLPGPNLNFNSPFGPLSPLNALPNIGPSIPGIPGLGTTGGTGGLGGLIQFPEQFLQAAAASTALLSMLTDVNFWIRVGEAIGALILIYMGLHALTGQGPSASGAVETGKKIAATAAEAGAAA